MDLKTKKIRSRLVRLGLDALLVSEEYDIRYLTGFFFSGMLMIFSRKGPLLCFVDPMNKTLAERIAKKSVIKIHIIPGDPIKKAVERIKKDKMKKVGIDNYDLSVFTLDMLIKFAPDTQFVSHTKKKLITSCIRNVRSIKSDKEIRILRKAAKETVRIWNKVKKEFRTGIREIDVAFLINGEISRRGYENSFPTIAAAGKNTAYPHAIPSVKRLNKGEHLLVDFGIKYKGYCSDLTRVYLNGKIDRQIEEFMKLVRKAQKSAIKIAKSNVTVSDLVKWAYSVFDTADVQDFVLHGLGHGVGLEVHECPILYKNAAEKLKKGMVVTFEPGLYKEGLGGIRIADMILITSKGCEVLTK